MKLYQYMYTARRELDNFADYWRERSRVAPDEYPMDLSTTDWDDQLGMFKERNNDAKDSEVQASECNHGRESTGVFTDAGSPNGGREGDELLETVTPREIARLADGTPLYNIADFRRPGTAPVTYVGLPDRFVIRRSALLDVKDPYLKPYIPNYKCVHVGEDMASLTISYLYVKC